MLQNQKEFYATATNKDGVHLMIDNLPEGRVQATNAAIEHCKQNGLIFQGIHYVKGSGKQNNTLTKSMEWKRGREFSF